MERLLLLRVQAQGCGAEAWLNDIPVARIGPQGGMLSLAVHEYLLDGPNELRLVIDPAPVEVAKPPSRPRLADQPLGARAVLLLPRIGQVGSELQARTLGELAWGVPQGEVITAPMVVTRSIALPVRFPRWRWMDAPPLDGVPSHREMVGAFLQSIAIDLLKGDPEPFLSASRLRLEELAQAYQRPVADLTARLRARLQLLHATKALRLAIPEPEQLVLRPCAGGRLIECLGPGGRPYLATEPAPDGTAHAWPIRLAVVKGHCIILR